MWEIMSHKEKLKKFRVHMKKLENMLTEHLQKCNTMLHNDKEKYPDLQ